MITLNIEDSNIKIAVVKGKQILKAMSIPVSPGMVNDGVVADPAVVGSLIKEILKVQGITEKQVIASISGVHAMYRISRIPKLSSNMLSDVASHEMEKSIPVPLAEIYTSWQNVSLSHDEDILAMVGLPHGNVDSVLETIHQAELDCKFMDLKPLAVARVIDEAKAIVINMQPQSFDISIVIDGIPEIVRSMPFINDRAIPASRLNELKEELERTVAFYNSNQQAKQVNNDTPLFISGDLQDMATEKLTIYSGGLGYQAKALPALLAYPDDFNVDEYAVNIGLAIKQITNVAVLLRVNINVLPEAFKPKKIPVIQIFSWVFIPVAVVILIIVGFNTQQAIAKTQTMQSQLNTAQEQIKTMQVTKAEIDKYQAIIIKVKADRDVVKKVLDALSGQRSKVLDNMGKITGSLSGLIKPTNINYGTSWTIKGVARDADVILSFVQTIKDTGAFSDVFISSMQEKSINEWEFILSIQ